MPVALQKFWADSAGWVSSIDPDGKIERKKFSNRKIAYKSHGHTFLRGEPWQTNFEEDFASADNEAQRTIAELQSLRPYDVSLAELVRTIKLLLKRDKRLTDMCKFYTMEERTHRNALLLIYSLLIRSPANRARYEKFPLELGFPEDQDVGKMNIHQLYRTAKECCERSILSSHYFVLLHSQSKTFLFGDGHLDWLTHALPTLRCSGSALIPLTPHLCVFFCTPYAMRRRPNCASVVAAPWMVAWVNDIVQVYSRDKLFFVGKPPTLSEPFRRREFLAHSTRDDAFIEMLNEVAGIKKDADLFGTLSLRVR